MKPDFYRKDGLLSHPEFSSSEASRGDGNPECQKCLGRGVVSVLGAIPPETRRCDCVFMKDIARRVEAGWKGIMKAKPLNGSSPVSGRLSKNTWVRASVPVFQSHLKHAAIRKCIQDPNWHYHVATDADLITSWLANTVVQGIQILDPDASVKAPTLSADRLTLADLVTPPDLLIVHLGVKQAANKEMPGVLYETLATRYAEDKPTWVFDQPYAMFTQGHRAWSPSLQDQMNVWEYEYLNLESGTMKVSHGDGFVEDTGVEDTDENIGVVTRIPARPIPPPPPSYAPHHDSPDSSLKMYKEEKKPKKKGRM